VYGVALTGEQLALDVAQTARLRDDLRVRLDGRASPAFSFGPHRDAFETKWTRERYAALTSLLAGVPVQWRYFIKHRIFEALDARIAAEPGACADGGPAIVHALFSELVANYPQLTAAA
jgi:N-methylhydantoinase B